MEKKKNKSETLTPKKVFISFLLNLSDLSPPRTWLLNLA